MIANRFNPLGTRPPLTAKSYIQDGLIAHWDGIENVGYGVHDSTSAVWKDLVGSNDMAITSNGKWGENGLKTSQGRYSAYVSMDNNANVTFEIVFAKYDESATGYICNIGRSGLNGFAHYNGIPEIVALFGSNRSAFYTSEINTISTYSVSMNGSSIAELFKDGSLAETVSSYTGYGAVSNLIAVGGRGNTSTASQNAFVCGLRIYSRALTAEEFSLNTSIDKERFGTTLLPTIIEIE